MSPDDGLQHWIGALRERLERGDLDEVAPLELGYGTGSLPGPALVRILLADRAALEAPTWAADDPSWRDERRRVLFDDFRRLRELLG